MCDRLHLLDVAFNRSIRAGIMSIISIWQVRGRGANIKMVLLRPNLELLESAEGMGLG